MDRLEQKYEQLRKALIALEKAITAIAAYEQTKKIDDSADDEMYRTHRDSLIQRFKYTIDLFWKYIKAFLEQKNALSGLKIPSEVIRTAFSINMLTEHEAEKVLEMIKSRNMTSHIYVEEIAEQLRHSIPGYCTILQEVVDRLKGSFSN